MTRLPVLEPRRTALENCTFCPKLSRSACPVSNAEPRETLTPWGKMSTAYFVANGDVPLDASFAAPAWACTGCFACRESCDHKNDVAATLLAARAAMMREGVGPAGAKKAIARFPSLAEKNTAGVAELRGHAGVRGDAPTSLLLGCTYVAKARPEAKDAIAAAAALEGGSVSLAGTCCGLPLLHAGDASGFVDQAQKLAREVRGKRRVLVADAGCAHALRARYHEYGVNLGTRVEVLVEAAARDLGRLRTVGAGTERVRYHDSCHLGRGLGVYEAPRAVLTRVLGAAPLEFDDRRERGVCSGGGGGMPITMPETAHEMARARTESAGGARIVTGCASSLVRMRKAGAEVDDLATWIARGLGK
jgi:dimethylglycine catabolism B